MTSQDPDATPTRGKIEAGYRGVRQDPDGTLVVSYRFAPSYSQEKRELTREALEDYPRNIRVRFEEVTSPSQPVYLTIESRHFDRRWTEDDTGKRQLVENARGWADLPHADGSTISISDRHYPGNRVEDPRHFLSVVIHEVNHVLGLTHVPASAPEVSGKDAAVTAASENEATPSIPGTATAMSPDGIRHGHIQIPQADLQTLQRVYGAARPRSETVMHSITGQSKFAVIDNVPGDAVHVAASSGTIRMGEGWSSSITRHDGAEEASFWLTEDLHNLSVEGVDVAVVDTAGDDRITLRAKDATLYGEGGNDVVQRLSASDNILIHLNFGQHVLLETPVHATHEPTGKVQIRPSRDAAYYTVTQEFGRNIYQFRNSEHQVVSSIAFNGPAGGEVPCTLSNPLGLRLEVFAIPSPMPMPDKAQYEAIEGVRTAVGSFAGMSTGDATSFFGSSIDLVRSR